MTRLRPFSSAFALPWPRFLGKPGCFLVYGTELGPSKCLLRTVVKTVTMKTFLLLVTLRE